MATVLLAKAITPRRLTGVPKVRRKAIPSIKNVSPSRWMSLPAGLVIVMVLSGDIVECVVFLLRRLPGVP